MRPTTLSLLVASSLALAGCDMLGIESATVVAARREAEGKAVGAGCRQAARSVEDCYSLNKRAEKAAVFAGWREMNDYMRENKLEAMTAAEDRPVALAAAADPGQGVPAAGSGAEKPGKADKPAQAAPKAAAKH